MKDTEKDSVILLKSQTYEEIYMQYQELHSNNKILVNKNGCLEGKITYLEEQLEALKRIIFGQKSESFILSTKEQQRLDLDIEDQIIDIEDINEEKDVKKKKKRGGRLRVSKDIPIEKRSIVLPEEERMCSHYNGPHKLDSKNNKMRYNFKIK